MDGQRNIILIIIILVDEQFGFRTNSPTMAATFSLINEIIDALN